MKNILPLVLALFLLLGLCACGEPENETTTTDTGETTQETTQETTEETKPLHSELYLPECTLEQMQTYFEEVVLHVEYSTGSGDPSVVQKWLSPIYYKMYGSPTDEDMAVLNGLFTKLNAVEGFPGIFEATDANPANLSLNFFGRTVFNETFSHVVGGEDAYGAVQYWYYTDTNEIYDGRIGYRTDIDQISRNSVLVEEIVNLLGISDTVVRTDSITYQYSNENMELSPVDWVILKLLYNPGLPCGSNVQVCRKVIAELYY